MSLLRIANGRVYDPSNGIEGEIRDLWIEHGKIIPPPQDQASLSFRTLDASGRIVMPGGIDIHSHIAGPKVNVARKFRPEDRRATPVPRKGALRSGNIGSTPTTFVTGYLYAGMGYTTAFDAAIPPLGARHTHEEFHDTPVIDKGFFVLLGNNHFALEQIAAGNQECLTAYAGWMLQATRGYAIKIVNPGGVENWKSGAGHDTTLDTPVRNFGTTPRRILQSLAESAMTLNLPHPVHVHCNQLGVPGNTAITLDTMQSLEHRRAHLTHIQFHSYGGSPDDQGTFASGVLPLVEYVNSHPNLSVDVGQVLFGDTTSMTGDGPLGYYLHKVTGRKWFNGDTEQEAGCGIVPIVYRDKSLVHALQWAIGLEWYLLMKDPWRIALSTDHPNGASFLGYPEIIHLLMDRNYRREWIDRLPTKVLERSVLRDLDREYTLNEIAIITRAAPAKLLGLKQKGHLGIGADADVTIYDSGTEYRKMFEMPMWVLKAGEIVVEQGEVRSAPFGPTWNVVPEYDHEPLRDLKDWFNRHYSIEFENFPVGEEYLSHGSREVRLESE